MLYKTINFDDGVDMTITTTLMAARAVGMAVTVAMMMFIIARSFLGFYIFFQTFEPFVAL